LLVLDGSRRRKKEEEGRCGARRDGKWRKENAVVLLMLLLWSNVFDVVNAVVATISIYDLVDRVIMCFTVDGTRIYQTVSNLSWM